MTKKKKSCKSFDLQDSLAEREGFEPPAPFSAAVFKTAVIDHSTISPFLVTTEVIGGSDVFGCKDSARRAKMQVFCLQIFPSRSLSYQKIVLFNR